MRVAHCVACCPDGKCGCACHDEHTVSHRAEVWPGSGLYYICDCDREFPTFESHLRHRTAEGL